MAFHGKVWHFKGKHRISWRSMNTCHLIKKHSISKGNIGFKGKYGIS